MLRAGTLSGRIAIVALLCALAGFGLTTSPGQVAAEEHVVVVTSPGDADDASCPGDACTLRTAIELANGEPAAEESDDGQAPLEPPEVIRFDANAFPPDDPATITLADGPLPAITANGVAVVAQDAGVVIDGSGIPAGEAPHDGLVFEGDNVAVTGLELRGFDGACLRFDGSSAAAGGDDEADGNRLVDCGTGIEVAEESATISGNAVSSCTAGIALEGAGGAVAANDIADCETGIEVAANETSIEANVVGGCETGIDVVADDTTVTANSVEMCGKGIHTAGTGNQFYGNRVGLDSEAGAFQTGFAVTAGDAAIGDEDDAGRTNWIGNATTGIHVGGGDEPATATVNGNVIGLGANDDPKPVETGVEIVPPGAGVRVTHNTIAHAESGIVIVDVPGTAPSTGNTLRENRYESLGTIAIDFGPTGNRTPNSDETEGPNRLIHHPTIERAVQAQIRGRVGCALCQIELYRANPRGHDEPAVPLERLQDAATLTAPDGTFRFDEPPVSPGDRVMGIVTDQEGNTSEFGEPARVGAGFLQCGNEQLRQGWNATGYFGSAVFPAQEFPPGSPEPGPVRAIHRLLPGTPPAYESWFAGGTTANDLGTMQPGEAFWFWSTGEITLEGGMFVNQPPPVELEPGWNMFIYTGPDEDVPVALAGLQGQFRALSRWVNDVDGGRWESYGSPDMPGWARGFTSMEQCGVYHVLVDQATTFVPPHP